MSDVQGGRRGFAERATELVVLGVVVGVLLVVSYPLGFAAWRVAAWMWESGGGVSEPPRVALRTLLAIASIALVATLMGVPSAWLLSRTPVRRTRLAALHAAVVAVPLFMPSYLAYAGWGLLRAPQTAVGDWLSSGPNSAVEIKFLIANHAIAIFGLAMWAYPLSSFVMAIFFRRISREFLDAFVLDGVPSRCTGGEMSERGGPRLHLRVRHAIVLLRMCLPGFGAGATCVALVMLGSVVPLDVAQVETYSIRLLRLVTQRERIEEAWLAAWPVYAVAIVAGVAILRRMGADPTENAMGDTRPLNIGSNLRRSVVPVAAAGVWTLATLVPIAMFMYHLAASGAPSGEGTRGWDRVLESSRAFWRDSHRGVLVSLRTAGVVATAGICLASAAWFITSKRMMSNCSCAMYRAFQAAVLAFLIMGLLPGVLIGSAAARAWTAAPAGWRLNPDWLIVACTHISRFGFLALLTGWWLAKQESMAGVALRRLDGAEGIRAWVATVVSERWPPVIGVGLALLALSLHEVEATVFVQPPGPQSLSQQLLSALHFARDDYLSAAVLNMMAFVGVVGAAVSLLIRSTSRDQP